MVDKGLSERRSLAIAGMSASAYRYATRADRNVALRQRIVALAPRQKRYGVGLIHLTLRQARTEETRVGNECVSLWRSRWSTYLSKTTTKPTILHISSSTQSNVSTTQ